GGAEAGNVHDQNAHQREAAHPVQHRVALACRHGSRSRRDHRQKPPARPRGRIAWPPAARRRWRGQSRRGLHGTRQPDWSTPPTKQPPVLKFLLWVQNFGPLPNRLVAVSTGPKAAASHTESIAKLPALLRKMLFVTRPAGGTYCLSKSSPTSSAAV